MCGCADGGDRPRCRAIASIDQLNPTHHAYMQSIMESRIRVQSVIRTTRPEAAGTRRSARSAAALRNMVWGGWGRKAVAVLWCACVWRVWGVYGL